MPLGRFNSFNNQNAPEGKQNAQPGFTNPTPFMPRGLQRFLPNMGNMGNMRNMGNQGNQGNLGQNPFQMRGLERFMQRHGMNLPGQPQGGMPQGPNPQGGFGGGPQGNFMNNPQGNLQNTLNVQAPQKGGGIKDLLSRFGLGKQK